MNFEQSIHPLSEFLKESDFIVAYKEQHFIRFSTNSAVITVAYASLEYLFYTHVGQDRNSLIELTPTAIKTVFKDNTFQFQSTLTIDNLISFLKGSGRSVLVGDPKVFKEMHEFSAQQSEEITKQFVHDQNLKGADKAWPQKDYVNFIKCIDKTDKILLPESYLKKYRIAIAKVERRSE